MIRLRLDSGRLYADFTQGEPVPEGATVGDRLRGWHEHREVYGGPGITPAETLPPEDTGSATLPPACKCELLEEPGTHPICDVFLASILHDDLCQSCYHAEGCHR